MTSPVWERFYPPGVRASFAPAPETLTDLFEEAVRRHESRIGLSFHDWEMSYGEWGAEARKVAAALRSRGIGPGDTVALYLPNSPFHLIFFFGALLAGARIAHFSPLDAHRELLFKCHDSEAKLLVTLAEAPFMDMAQRLFKERAVPRVVLCEERCFLRSAASAPGRPNPGAFIETCNEFLSGASDDAPSARCAPHDIALLQYTGGTTGRAKAALLTHANLTAATRIYEAWFRGDGNSGPDARVLLMLPLFHIFALVAILLRRITEGSLLILRRRFDASEALDLIEQKRVTSLSGVPTMWVALANHASIGERDLSSLESITSGGAPLPVAVYERVKQLTGLNLRGGWGMTETCAAGTNLPPDMPPSKLGTVGLPMPGITVEIVDPSDPRKILAANQVGELRIKGPNVASGYWRVQEAERRSWQDGHLLTGDLARMDEDGFVYIVDRKKDLIISGGFNLYPQAIENAIMEYPAVAEVIVIGVPDAYRGEAAKAFIVLKAGEAEFSLETLQGFLAERLGRHEMPRALAFLQQLPKTSVGKLSRKQLRDQQLKQNGWTAETA